MAQRPPSQNVSDKRRRRDTTNQRPSNAQTNGVEPDQEDIFGSTSGLQPGQAWDHMPQGFGVVVSLEHTAVVSNV